MTLKAPPAQAQSLARHDAVHATRLRADGVTIAGITGRDRLTRSTLYRHLTVREPEPVTGGGATNEFHGRLPATPAGRLACPKLRTPTRRPDVKP